MVFYVFTLLSLLENHVAMTISAVVFKNLHTTFKPKTKKRYTNPDNEPTFGSKILTVNFYDASGKSLACSFEEPVRLKFPLSFVSSYVVQCLQDLYWVLVKMKINECIVDFSRLFVLRRKLEVLHLNLTNITFCLFYFNIKE